MPAAVDRPTVNACSLAPHEERSISQATITSKGKITNPADARSAMGFGAGERLLFTCLPDGTAIMRRLLWSAGFLVGDSQPGNAVHPITVLLELEWVVRVRHRFGRASIELALVALLEARELPGQPEGGVEPALQLLRQRDADLADWLHVGLSATEGQGPMSADVDVLVTAPRMDGAEVRMIRQRGERCEVDDIQVCVVVHPVRQPATSIVAARQICTPFPPWPLRNPYSAAAGAMRSVRPMRVHVLQDVHAQCHMRAICARRASSTSGLPAGLENRAPRGPSARTARRPPQVGASAMQRGRKRAPGSIRMVPVVVLGGGITALGVLRSFARRGVTVFGVCSTRDMLRRSRYYRDLPGYVADDAGLPDTSEALAGALAQCDLPRAVLVACSDRFSAAVTGLPTSLDERFPRSIPSAATMALLNDKGRLAELLQSLGVAHPFTQLVRDDADLEVIAARPDDALFLKPCDSQRFFATFGVKAHRVGAVEEARQRLRTIAPHGLEMVLQAYVPGPTSHHYFIDGFRDAGGSVRVRLARQRLRIYPKDFGNSTHMVSVPLATMGAAPEQLDRLLAATGYRGIFSAEFKKDARDGSFRLIEVNTRPWWQVDFAVRSGADVCDMVYRDALGLPVADVVHTQVGRRWMYPYHDLFALRDARAAGDRTGWLAWAASIPGAMQPIFAWDDPYPAIRESMRTLGALFGGVSSR